ncbi:VanZ family protein, partial [Paenibacillus sp. EPM92]|uniref:VanZ family protein n=1 Tax=Paenibacillus sp. EPM92 TaxID=1561195 RepID=UPI00280448F2
GCVKLSITSSVKHSNKRKFFWTHWLPLLVWMLVIFLFSSQPYEKQDLRPWLTDKTPEHLIVKNFSDVRFHYGGSEVSIHTKGALGFVEFFVRKSAHLIEYLILGFLTLRLLAGLLTNKYWLLVVIALLFCSVYASLDEIHQSLTPHRTSMLTDVLLDTIGAALGIMIYMMIKQIRTKYGKGVQV